MLKFRYSQDRDFLFRSALKPLHLRNGGERDGGSTKATTAQDRKTGGKKDGGQNIEHANAAIGYPIR
jgi:hypothetical protein